MDLTNLFHIDRIILNADLKTKEEVISYLLNLVNKSGLVENVNEVKEEIFKRESVMTTGIGNGIAIPHAKSKYIKGIVGAACVLANPINFDSIDEKPVKMCFMILGNETKIGEHLRLLSKIGRLMGHDEFRNELENSNSPEKFLELFNKFN